MLQPWRAGSSGRKAAGCRRRRGDLAAFGVREGGRLVGQEIRIHVPEKAEYILETLYGAGYEAYVVGGCVRDAILGREPEDWDITTSARPEQVKALFPRTVDTGLQHGTVTVMLGQEGFEVTTYRIDGKYEDGRHPAQVQFTPSLREDLKRRDLTINAMAYNRHQGLVDSFGGLADIQAGRIRCVGDAGERFGEDALRILRAIRFSAQLGYGIQEDTAEAIRRLAPALEKISKERIQAELVKLLCSPHPEVLRLAYDSGVTKVILPEFDRMMETAQNHPHHCYSVGEHTLRALCFVDPGRILRLAVLLHDIGKPDTLEVDGEGITHFHGHAQVGAAMAQNILERLRFDHDTIRRVCRLVLFHDYGNSLEPDLKAARRLLHKAGEGIVPDLFAVKRADIMAQSGLQRQEKLHRADCWQQLSEKVLEEKQCISLKDLAVTGKDLLGLGMKPGRELGVLLEGLLSLVLEDPSLNTREGLLARAREMLAQT